MTRLSHAPWLKYLRQNTYAMHVSQSWSSCLHIQFFSEIQFDIAWWWQLKSSYIFKQIPLWWLSRQTLSVIELLWTAKNRPLMNQTCCYPQPYRYHQTTAAIIHYIMVRRMAGGGLDEHPGSRLGGSRRKWRAEATHSARSIDIAPLGTSKSGQVHIANKDIRNTRVAITVYCLATRIGMCHCSKSLLLILSSTNAQSHCIVDTRNLNSVCWL